MHYVTVSITIHDTVTVAAAGSNIFIANPEKARNIVIIHPLSIESFRLWCQSTLMYTILMITINLKFIFSNPKASNQTFTIIHSICIKVIIKIRREYYNTYIFLTYGLR